MLLRGHGPHFENLFYEEGNHFDTFGGIKTLFWRVTLNENTTSVCRDENSMRQISFSVCSVLIYLDATIKAT